MNARSVLILNASGGGRNERYPFNIISATRTGEYLIRLRFDDQSEQEVNFKRFLTYSNHPDIRAYLDPVRFGAFRIEYGESNPQAGWQEKGVQVRFMKKVKKGPGSIYR